MTKPRSPQGADFGELVPQLEKWIADFNIKVTAANRAMTDASQRGDSTTFALRLVDYMHARRLRQRHISAWEEITGKQWDSEGTR